MNGTELVSVIQNGATQNNLTMVQGSVNNHLLTRAQLVMDTPVVLCYDRPWVIEWGSKGNWDGMLFGSTLESPSDGLTYLFRYAPMSFLAFGEYTGSWNNYGVILDLDMTVSHVFRLENRIAADGSNAVYLLVDGQEIDAMHHYYVGGTNKNETVNWSNSKDIVFANIGTATHPVSGMQLDDLWVWENGHEHIYEKGICIGCGAEDHDYVPLPTLTLKSPTLEFKDMISINAFFTAENTENVVEMGMITYKSKVDEWNVENAEYVIPGVAYVESSSSYYASSQGIHAKQLADEIYLAVYAKLSDGSYVYSKLVSYSATAYAYNQLEKSDDVKLKQLLVAMLKYGAEAQAFFCYNPENPANAALTEEQLALPEAYSTDLVQSVPGVSIEKQSAFVNNQGFSIRKPAVSFEGAFSINYFFTPAYAPVGEITLYYWNEADFGTAEILTADNATGSLTMVNDISGQYRGDITGIAAKNLTGAIYVAAVYSDGTTDWTSGVLGYSIGAYCSSQAAKGGAVAELAKATAVYGYHAKTYFG